MKKCILKILAICTLAAVVSCGTLEDPCTYKGGIVYEKDYAPIGMWIKVKKAGEYSGRIYIPQSEWCKYKIGDTINCR